MTLEPRGIQTIVDAMARHRSDRDLQKTAVRALFTLAKDELALQACRAGGGTGLGFVSESKIDEETGEIQKHKKTHRPPNTYIMLNKTHAEQRHSTLFAVQPQVQVQS